MATPLSLVLFDMDDVLCHYDRDARYAHLSRRTGHDAETIRHALWGTGLEWRADQGELDGPAYLEALSRQLDCRITLEDWLSARRAAMQPNFEVLRLAQRVASRARIAVLTNNSRLVADHIAFLCPEIAALFGDTVHASAMFQAAKPAAEVYLRCLEHLQASAGQTLFIDDLEENISGAIAAGLHGHHFTGTAALERDLCARGLI
jgi:putative hydrolase of the HAD superfamily